MIAYTVRVPDPRLHTLEIEVHVPNPGEELTFSIPAWTPGSYLLREFARYLGEPTCDVDGSIVEPEKLSKGTWRVATRGAAEVVLRYPVFGYELTVRTPHVDGTHAFFVGTNALVYVHGRESEPVRVAVVPPPGWQVFCPLDHDPDHGFVAPNYDVLADAPFELGPHTSHVIEILGVRHRLVFWGDDVVDLRLEALKRDITAIVEANAATFGGALPYARYDFVFHITESGRGGLEHLNSCVLATPWRYFDTDDGYAEMLGLISHEHFHVWNVKRIRPRALGPFDYQAENHTTALWIAEGFTSYYDSLTCVRAGVVDPPKYLEGLGRDIGQLLAIPGRFRQSLAKSSWDAWIRLYRPDPDTPNRTVSYYLKGSLVALALDMTLRERSAGRRSLDDVMRALWSDFQATGDGYDEREIARTIHRATGVDVADQLLAWVHGTDDPPLRSVLATHGVLAEMTAEEGPWLGLDTERAPGGLAVKHVRSDGPAHGGELAPGDLIVAVGGRQATEESLPGIRSRLSVGTPVEVHAFRRGRLFSTTLTPCAAPATKVRLSLVENPTEDQRTLFEHWTRRPWPPPERGPA